MNITIRQYTDTDKLTILEMFDDFQDYLISIDPLNRLRKLPGHAEVALRETLEEVEKSRGTFLLAVDNGICVRQSSIFKSWGAT